MGVPRALFLYHYLTPLLFSLCAIILWLDHVRWIRGVTWSRQRWSFHAAMAALVVGLIAMSPFTFSFVTASAQQRAFIDMLLK